MPSFFLQQNQLNEEIKPFLLTVFKEENVHISNS